MLEQYKKLGNEWQKGNLIYFNDLPKWFGLEVKKYNSGSIRSARLDNEEISNSSAKAIIGRLSFPAKVWLDISTMKFRNQGLSQKDFDKIVVNIMEKAKNELHS